MSIQKKMRIAFVLALCLLFAALPAMAKGLSDEYEQLFIHETITAEDFDETLNYRLYVPRNYDPQKAYPVVLYLHGYGERDNLWQTNTAQLEKGMMPNFFGNGYHETYECIIVAPQCPMGKHWVYQDYDGSYTIDDMEQTGYTFTQSIQLCKLAVDKTCEQYNVDETRIYVTGISMGGYATWNLLIHYPNYFAAAIPVCGGGDPSKAELLVDMPIWCFHGEADRDVPVSGSRDMYEAITQAGGTSIRYTEWEGVGHAWDPAYCREDLWQWLFSQNRTQPPESMPPIGGGKHLSMPRYKNEKILRYMLAHPALMTASGCACAGTITGGYVLCKKKKSRK